MKVEKKKFYTYDDDLLYVGDTIQVMKVEQKPTWKIINGKWIENEEITEPYLEKCKIIRKSHKRNT